MAEVFRKGNRAFLNRDGFHEDASLSWTFTVSDTGYFHGDLCVRDCDRNINLEINIHDDKWYENSKHKLDTMIALLQEARKNLPKARKALKKAKGK